MPNIVVGMDNRINAVKQILLPNDVDRLGITGMGANHLTVSVFMVRHSKRIHGSSGFFHAIWAACKMGMEDGRHTSKGTPRL